MGRRDYDPNAHIQKQEREYCEAQGDFCDLWVKPQKRHHPPRRGQKDEGPEQSGVKPKPQHTAASAF
jgi:hypothetical protein